MWLSAEECYKSFESASFLLVGTPRCGVRTAQRAVPTFKLIYCESFPNIAKPEARGVT